MEATTSETQLQTGKTTLPQTRSRSSAQRHWFDSLMAAAFFGDTAAIVSGLLTAFWIRFNSGWITFGTETNIHDLSDYSLLFLIGVLFFYLTFFWLGFYSPSTLFRFRPAALVIAKGTTFWVLSYLGLSLALKFDPPISRIYAFLSFFCTFWLLLAWRGILSRILQSKAFSPHLCQRILIVGWTQEVSRLVKAVASESTRFYEVIGYVSCQSRICDPHVESLAHLGTFEEIEPLLRHHQPDAVVLAESDLDQEKTMALANFCERHFIDFKKIPSYFQIMVSGLHLEMINGVPMLGIAGLPLDRLSNRILKRLVDILGSTIGLVISVPFILICGVRVYMESQGLIFFPQERVGCKGARFNMYKMRTMKPGSERFDHLNQSTLRDDPRLLEVGKWMRRWNIDELPQFWNVLKGDMSLVGPRPERTSHSFRLSDEIPHYNARYNCKPGMTGWAQVNGLRGDTSLTERIRYDLFYLENWTLWLDFQIMAQTLFRRENAY